MRIQANKMKEMLQLYFIMGTQNTNSVPLEVLEQAISGGITMFQFREKGRGSLSDLAKEELARNLMKLCKIHSVPFIVNDDVDLALAIDANGVHVGQDDEKADQVRRKIGDKILGVSAHTMDEVRKAIEYGADYLGIGPIFPTESKEDAKPPNGGALIKEIRKAGISIPIVGIGGITAENAAAVMETGADGISLISAISHAKNPEKAALDLKLSLLSNNRRKSHS
ncbi:thiamine phosphate synthase [Falsibacillus pallidus]|uniref:Thiamine-phosphate synthase n=1 Tax=Falsibacillus pallidus TaxID=493781 RepID=A0A370GXL3_9BACI|nr:thiamine phosphate synthase [Falsibacillus pallidus]RDI48000.1 thiamine-phosphate diphosphorylase [Falsibacillus pallidus]